MNKLEPHELLKGMPMMPSHEIDALGEDIKQNGLIHPIVLMDGKIIDGRNRYEACTRMKIKPSVVHLPKDKAKGYVGSANYFRKHWTTQERSMYAALLTIDRPPARPKTTANAVVLTQKEAAKRMAVSVDSVHRAKDKLTGKNDVHEKAVSKSNGEIDQRMDENGLIIPVSANAYWDRKEEAQVILGKIREAKKAVKALMPDDPMWCEVNLNGVLADLSNASNRFAAAVPAHVCPYCKGIKVDDCKACKGRGVVSAYFYKTAVPEEMKK